MNNKAIYLQITFLVSLVATLGSLYFSEVLKFEPCKFCWIQRIFMYPLVIISLISVIQNNFKNHLLIAVMSGIGFCFSVYHYLLQHIPALQESNTVCGLTPCTTIYINWFDFITIPFLAGTAFLLIFISNLISLKKIKD